MGYDFSIVGVRYNSDKSHIEYVKVREELKTSLGAQRIVPREFVADLIRMKKVTFLTRVWNAKTDMWSAGAEVHDIEGVYLTTDKNSTKRDNLGNLPEF